MKSPRSINTVYDIDFLLNVEMQMEPVIDLSSLQYTTPVGIVAVLATIERIMMRQPKRGTLDIIPPSDKAVQEYLLQVGMFQVMRDLGGQFVGTQPEDEISAVQPVFPMVKCARFTNEREIEKLAEEMDQTFLAQLSPYASLGQACNVFFSELATNVVYHSESGGGYVLAQQYQNHGRPLIEIAVVDCGIGIRASLRKNPKYATMESDGVALQRSLDEGVSSIQDAHRGYGLHHVTNALREASGRVMTMRSGTYGLNKDSTGVISLAPRLRYYDGTIVSVTIQC